MRRTKKGPFFSSLQLAVVLAFSDQHSPLRTVWARVAQELGELGSDFAPETTAKNSLPLVQTRNRRAFIDALFFAPQKEHPSHFTSHRATCEEQDAVAFG